MSDITLSAGVRSNLLSLQNTAKMMESTQTRLATGKEVNSALDDPTNFFTSQSLNARSNDLSSLLDSMSNGIKTIEAADNGLSAITNTLETMQATLRQARQDASFQTGSFGISADTIGVGEDKTVSFSGGAIGNDPVEVALNEADSDQAVQATVETDDNSYTAPTAATSGTFTLASADFTSSTLGSGDTITFDIEVDGGGTQSITIDEAAVQAAGNGDTVIDDMDELAEILTNELSALDVSVDVNGDGDLVVTSDSAGSGSSVSISNLAVDDDSGDGTVTMAGLDEGSSEAGADAVDRVIEINGEEVTLTSANAADAEAAAATINTALEAADIDVTATGDNDAGKIELSGLADGSNDITLGGADVDDVFGASRTNTAGEEASGDGEVFSVDALVSAINGNADLEGKIRASNDNGELRIENLSTQDLTVTGVSDDGNIDGDTGTSEIGGNEVRAGLADEFNTLRDQLDKLSDDASFNGINLLRGDQLTLTFNETGTSEIDIQTQSGEAINSANLDLFNIEASQLDGNTSIDGLISDVSNAMNGVRAQSSNFGSNLSIVENRTEFTEKMMNTLQTGADSLVLADTNEEGANMLALQTRQQLSSVALSMASQSDQAVLRLF